MDVVQWVIDLSKLPLRKLLKGNIVQVYSVWVVFTNRHIILLRNNDKYDSAIKKIYRSIQVQQIIYNIHTLEETEANIIWVNDAK